MSAGWDQEFHSLLSQAWSRRPTRIEKASKAAKSNASVLLAELVVGPGSSSMFTSLTPYLKTSHNPLIQALTSFNEEQRLGAKGVLRGSRLSRLHLSAGGEVRPASGSSRLARTEIIKLSQSKWKHSRPEDEVMLELHLPRSLLPLTLAARAPPKALSRRTEVKMGTRGDGGGVGMADPLDFSPMGNVTSGDSIRPLIKCVNRVRCTELTCFTSPQDWTGWDNLKN